MSGGGKKSPTPQDTTTKSAEMPMIVVEPFMPGFDNQIAKQLAQGFGGSPSTYMNTFQQTYSPMHLPSYAPPPVAPKKKASSGSKTALPNGGLIGLHKWRDTERD